MNWYIYHINLDQQWWENSPTCKQPTWSNQWHREAILKKKKTIVTLSIVRADLPVHSYVLSYFGNHGT